MMTNRYHATPIFGSHARRISSGSIALVAAAITIAVAALLWSMFSVQTQSMAHRAAIEEARSAIGFGMSRSEVYTVLRAHGLVAVNPAFAAWTKSRLNVWYRSEDGAWPQPNDPRPMMAAARPINPANPEVEIRLTSGARGGCGMATIEQLMFDRYDRVKSIAFGDPYWTCQ